MLNEAHVVDEEHVDLEELLESYKVLLGEIADTCNQLKEALQKALLSQSQETKTNVKPLRSTQTAKTV